MAWTQTDLDNIEKAMASGQRKVRLGQREVEYHSIEQMIKARDFIKADVAKTTAVVRRPSAYRSRTSKGL